MSLLANSQSMLQTGLNLLFPPSCLNCQAPGRWLCRPCREALATISAPVCNRCGMPPPVGQASACLQCQHNPLLAIDLIRSAAYFEDSPLRPAIHALKYQGRKVVAQELAEIMAEACERFGLAADVIMPVPLHQSRLRKRGFNQSELLARGLSVLKSIPLDTKSLIRSRPTQSQMELSAAERHENVKDAFECCRPVAGLTVLLIDDVCTTGSTLDYCATALKANQAKAVMGLTLARAR